MAAMKYCVMVVLLRVLLYSIPVMATTTTFKTNCTRPSVGTNVNYVTGPNTRGTFDILWSCIFTLIICTWKLQHFNVPPLNSKDVALYCTKPLWMLLTLLAPELLLAIALGEYLQAGRSVTYMRHELPELVEQGGWTRTHAFYVNMYGFMLRRRVVVQPDLATTPVSRDTIVANPDLATTPISTDIIIAKPDLASTPVSKDTIIAKPDLATTPSSRNIVISEPELATTPSSTTIAIDEPDLATTRIFRDSEIPPRDLLVLNTERMVIYLKSLPSPIVFTTEVDIQRKAKTDIFLKYLAGVQVLSFMVQVIARWTHDLKISQLEIVTFAFAVCTLISYWLWREKPQDVSVPTFLDEGPEATPTSDDWFDSRPRPVTPFQIEQYLRSNLPLEFEVDTFARLGFCLGGIIFGAIHLLAWDFKFPTFAEREIWWYYSGATTALPLVILCTTSVLNLKPNSTFIRFQVSFYIGFRVVILAESLRTLRYLPAGAFDTVTWSTYIPHVI